MDDFPRIAIKCKNGQCPDRGRVLAETDGARLWMYCRTESGQAILGGYLLVKTTLHCPACNARVVWSPQVCYTVVEEVAA